VGTCIVSHGGDKSIARLYYSVQKYTLLHLGLRSGKLQAGCITC
jgi:hypothetical protein